jgi:hypothetical protein
VLALAVALFVYYRRARKVVAISFAAIIFGMVLVQKVVYGAFNIESSPFMESMSVPAQQLGYVVSINGLDEDTDKELSKYADIKCLEENYTPMNADPAKNCFNYGLINDNKLELIKIWFRVLPRRLMDYIKAYVLHTYSYWYVQGSVWDLDFGHTHEEKWLKTEYTDLSLLGDNARNIIKNIELGLTSTPWLGWTNSVGVLFWSIYFVLIMFLYRKHYKMLVFLVCIFVYMISLLIASPISWIFRYVYSLMLILPILVVMCFIKERKEK